MRNVIDVVDAVWLVGEGTTAALAGTWTAIVGIVGTAYVGMVRMNAVTTTTVNVPAIATSAVNVRVSRARKVNRGRHRDVRRPPPGLVAFTLDLRTGTRRRTRCG